MKTPMQELVEIMNKDQVSFTEWFIDNYELFIKKEKDHIIDAYSQGYGDGVQEPNPNDNYYNETYR